MTALLAVASYVHFLVSFRKGPLQYVHSCMYGSYMAILTNQLRTYTTCMASCIVCIAVDLY